MPPDPPRGNMPTARSIQPPSEINCLSTNKFRLLRKLATSLNGRPLNQKIIV